MTSRALRLVRGWTAAFIATAAALLAHVAAGGQWPSPMVMALCVVLSAPICMLLAGIRLPLVGLIAAVVSSQALFHGLLSASGGYVTVVDHTGHGAHSGAHTGAVDVVLVPATQGSLAVEAAHGGHTSMALGAGADAAGHSLLAGGAAMLATHLVAAVLAVLVLRYGEVGVLKAVTVLMLRAVRLSVAVAMPWVMVPPWRPGHGEPLPVRVSMWARSFLRYRGPPEDFALAA